MIPRQYALSRAPASSGLATRTLAGLGAVILSLGVFAAVAAIAIHGRGMAWDTHTLRFAERHYEATYVNALDLILRASLGLSLAASAGAAVLLFKARNRRAALFWALAIGGVLALDLPLKHAFQRPVLAGPGDYAFPSGNAMVSVALLLAFVLGASPRWRKKALVVGVPLVLAYGVALVYAWWHYPTDVIGGWSFAVAWVSCLWLLLLGRPGQR